MAGDWIKMQTCLPDKPEVWRIASIIGCEPDAVIGKLLRVWSWFDSHTEDGNAEVGVEVIDKIAGCQGFAAALHSVKWMLSLNGFLTIPNFDRHNGKSAKNRIATSERVAKHRASKTRNENVTRNVIPRPIQNSVKARDKSTCVYCGRVEGEYVPPETSIDARMHIDHVIPHSQGGSDDIENLVCACNVCNLFKSDRTPDECGLPWPEVFGKRLGNKKSVTKTVTREEKRREEVNLEALSGKPDPVPVEAVEKQSEVTQAAKRILEFLNLRSGKRFHPTQSNIAPIVARLREGYSEQDIRTVTMRKVSEWLPDEKMQEYIRPKTLFNATNFNSYAGIL